MFSYQDVRENASQYKETINDVHILFKCNFVNVIIFNVFKAIQFMKFNRRNKIFHGRDFTEQLPNMKSNIFYHNKKEY